MSKKPSPSQSTTLARRTSQAFGLLMFVVVPLFIYRPAIDASLVPKFLLLTGLLLVFLPVLHFQLRKKMPLEHIIRQTPVLIWMAFIGLSVLSLVVAYNPWVGLFDILRAGILLCFLLILMLYLELDLPLRSLRLAIIALGWIQAVIGLYQYSVHVFGETDLQQLYLINGLMTHKNIFSGMMFLTLPILGYSIFVGSRWERNAAASAITLELIMLLLMQTRAQWLAVVGLLLLTAILAILIPGVRHAMRDSGGRRALLLAGLSLFLAIGAASLLTRASLSAARKQQQEIPAEGKAITGLGERAASIVDNTTENRKTRLVIWKYTWEMIQDKPWLGVGAGNWKLVAPMYYDEDYMTTYYHNWRRPHNDFLQVAAEKGIPALMVYLAFFVMLALRGIRYLMRSENKARILQVLFALGGLAGYSIDSMFSFSYERVDEGMMMMLFAGIIIKADMEIRQLPVKAIQTRKPWVTYAIPAFLLLCLPPGLSWVGGEIATKEAYAYNNAGRWAEAVRAIDKSYGKLNQIDPSNNPLLWFRGKAHMQMGHMDQARMDLETALVQKPGSITVLTELGVLFGRMGEHAKAVEVLKEAHEILPSDRLVLFNLGLAYYKMNKYREALDYLYPCLTDKEDTQLNSLIRDAEEKLFGPRLAEEGAGQAAVPGK